MSVTLALDLGSRTGWAVAVQTEHGSSIRCWGTWDIAPRRGESPGMRYIRLRACLEDVRRAYQGLGLRLVLYEQAHHRGGAATEYALGCVATVQAWCAEHGIEHAAVHASRAKKVITGSGRADKDAVRARLRLYGYHTQTTDESDAIALLWASPEATEAPQRHDSSLGGTNHQAEVNAASEAILER